MSSRVGVGPRLARFSPHVKLRKPNATQKTGKYAIGGGDKRKKLWALARTCLQ